MKPNPAIVCLLVLATALPSAALQTFTVDGSVDRPDVSVGDGVCEAVFFQDTFCSLRAAIQESNAAGGGATIFVPAGTYTLSLVGVGPDSPTVGDLDITAPVSILGTGGVAVIDAQDIDRVVHVAVTQPPNVVFSFVDLVGGDADDGAGDGGGLYVEDGAVTFTDGAVRGNRASRGGGIFTEAEGSVLLDRASIRDNLAVFGGGIYGSGLIRRSEIVNNDAGTGPAARARSGRSLSILHSTISANTGAPGAIYCSSTRIDLTSTTVHDNEGAALAVEGSCELNPESSILSGGCSAIPGLLADFGDNLESPGDSCGLSPMMNLLSVGDPGLKPLAYYGGPTRSHALKSDSLARDFSSTCSEADQREAPRSSPNCDTGALEYGATSPLPGIFADGFESGDSAAWQ
ncbi:MAG: hypothetical protein DWQ36_05760 [Acidobacteria bacterium]|nr:MAG: hypothetical protein DWQ30_08760 [Acidobacteriota bacterium]REK09768.1 MAG: hypothetical protein DWQ36_05760 [Acidobacteriota bacterium]